MQAPAPPVLGDPELLSWLSGAKLNKPSTDMLMDPAKGFTKEAFALSTLPDIKEAFPGLPPGQLILLMAAIKQLQQEAAVARNGT